MPPVSQSRGYAVWVCSRSKAAPPGHSSARRRDREDVTGPPVASWERLDAYELKPQEAMRTDEPDGAGMNFPGRSRVWVNCERAMTADFPRLAGGANVPYLGSVSPFKDANVSDGSDRLKASRRKRLVRLHRSRLNRSGSFRPRSD